MQKLFHIYQGWRVTISVKSAKETIDPVLQLSRENAETAYRILEIIRA